MSTRYWLVAIGVAVGLAGGGWAAERYVAPGGTNDAAGGYTTWPGAATNIQWAIDKADSNDTVWVSNGTYVLTNQILIQKPLWVKPWTGNTAPVIVDGNHPVTTNRCLYLNHSNALVEGMTFTNGSAPPASVYGGGVRIAAGTLRDCLVTGCRETNSAVWNNGYGGGIHAAGAQSLVTNCRIVANTSQRRGGGVYLASSAQLWNSRIERNVNLTAPDNSQGAGGVYVDINCQAVNCAMISNAAATTRGGGACAVGGGARLRNCLVTGNSAASGSGVSYHNSTTNAFNELVNCTIASNAGVGLFVSYNPGNALWCENTILYSNTVDISRDMYLGGATSFFYYTCTSSTNTLIGAGNVTNPPAFAAPAAGNFRLARGSPCIDAGTNQAWMETAADLDGRARLDRFARRVDIGCYEYLPAGAMLRLW